MNNFSIAITLGLTASIFGILGSLVFIGKKKSKKRIFSYLLPLGAGVLFSAAVLDMVPEVVKKDSSGIFWLGLGYFIIYFFAHVFSSHFHFGEEDHEEDVTKQVAWSIFLTMLIYSFFQGIIIGGAFSFSYLLGLVVFFSIALHKFTEGYTMSSVMALSGRGKPALFGTSFVLFLATMAGVFWSVTFPVFMLVLFPVALGAILHLCLSDLVPQVAKRKSLLVYLVVVSGVLLYYVVKIGLIWVQIA